MSLGIAANAGPREFRDVSPDIDLAEGLNLVHSAMAGASIEVLVGKSKRNLRP
jgi:hypothetical protein